MANHYFGINDFELVKAMHEDGVDITMEGLGPWGDKDGYDEFMEEHEEFQTKEWKVQKAMKMLNELGLTIEDLK